ncbi:MAG: LUD domain-containing protein, partial [Dehalococcoidia bacterium]|nr:LUD domain-containing protein [Dehalococcoidia bacterium]
MDKKFRGRVKEAVANSQVRLALRRATSGADKGHAANMASIDWEGMRRELRAVKEDAIRDLPELAQRFKSEAEKAGAVVYEATDAAAARSYALDLARSRGVKMAVKSKSMLTEEIELNRYLEAAGVQAVETDLGEWIIQLAGERPSHFVAPAIHKTREDIAILFSQKLGIDVPPDPPTMTRLARKELRRCFIEADLGISGANMAVAETGSLVIVTNEGNGRLVSTLPPAHLAFVGYEKIIPGLTDSALVLKLLSRSAGGGKMTAYVSYITGPSRTMDIEKTLVWGVHGPEEVHIVLVDNGRLRMREDDDFREALY